MSFYFFTTSFFDEEEKQEINTCYFTSPKNYFYKQVYREGELVLHKRISEQEYISAYEARMNY